MSKKIEDRLSIVVDGLAETAGVLGLPFVSYGVRIIRETAEASRSQRLKDFFEALENDGASEEELKSWLADPEGRSYFTTLFQWMLDDDEDRKAALYAEAWKTLVRGVVPADRKRDFVTAFRVLRSDDFQRLCEWVPEMRADKAHRESGGSVSYKRWRPMTGDSADEATQMAVQRCRLAGVLREQYGDRPSEPTGLGCLIVEHALSSIKW